MIRYPSGCRFRHPIQKRRYVMNEDSRMTTIHMSLASLRDLVARLNLSAGALSVLGAAINGRTTGEPFAAALTDRIELRRQAAEDLTDIDSFDLAWIPSAFILDSSITAVAQRVYRALRPDGWVLFAMINPGSDPLASSFARLRTTIWGGAMLTPSEAHTMLESIGFVAVQTLPTPPSATVAMIAGRRPSQTSWKSINCKRRYSMKFVACAVVGMSLSILWHTRSRSSEARRW